MGGVLGKYVAGVEVYQSIESVRDAFRDYEFFEREMSDEIERYRILVGKKREELADIVLCYSEKWNGWFEAGSDRVKEGRAWFLKKGEELRDGLYTLRERIRVFD